MEIRQLRDESDMVGVLRVHDAAWRAAYSNLLEEDILNEIIGEPSPERAGTAFANLKDHLNQFLVAEDNESNIQGYAYIRWGDDEMKSFVEEDEAYLKEIYVDPDHWGEGIGSNLLEHCISLLPESTTALKLEILSGNEIGARFYDARGFKKAGTAETDLGGNTFETTLYSQKL